MAEETEKERRYFQLQMCEVFILYIWIKHSSISACKLTRFDYRFKFILAILRISIMLT